MVVSWLMQDGWEVFLPVLDHGHQTDILISDGPNYFRIQVKTVGASGDDHEVHNQRKESNVNCVVFSLGIQTGAMSPQPLKKKSDRLTMLLM